MVEIKQQEAINTLKLKQILKAGGKEKTNFTGKIILAAHHLPFQFTIPLTQQAKELEEIRKQQLIKKHQRQDHFDRSVNNNNNNNFGDDDDDDEGMNAPISHLAKRRSTLYSLGHSDLWEVSPRAGHSAMYSGIDSLKSQYKTLFVGGTGSIRAENSDQCVDVDDLTSLQRQNLSNLLLSKHNMVPIFMKNDVATGHYEGYCKKVLWPLFHYVMWDSSVDESEHWDNYVKVNQFFANTIAENYEDGDLVWIHDYHLLLVPEMLRALKPEALIGLFLHLPFPSSEIFRCLPHRREILNGMLGSNLVGFQTYNYARHFESNCTRILGYEHTPMGVQTSTCIVDVGIFPIGIDVEKTRSNCNQPGVDIKVKAIRERYSGKYIIVGRDKLDPMKGVLQKLEAFEKFLTDYPEWQDKVVLIQVTSPGVIQSPRLEAKVAEVANRINTNFGSIAFTPVNHYHQHIDRDEYYALLKAADIGLLTPICDGMNTTSFEFAIAQEKKHSPLILSEFAGTAHSMSAASIVNPWDYSWVSSAINECLTMSDEEKYEKSMLLGNFVNLHTASYWATSFINKLTNSEKSSAIKKTTKIDPNRLKIEYKATSKRLFFFDYDGTLTPICETPEEAKPSEKTLKALNQLCKNPLNIVWVVSGRDQKTLEEWLGHIPNLGLSAEHGCFSRFPNADTWINNSDRIDMSWKDDVREIFKYYTERTPGSFYEEKRSSLTWHYRKAEPKYGMVGKLPVETICGKKNLEVRPTLINKGGTVKQALNQYSNVDFILCAGDDRTDEDMFRIFSNNSNSLFSDKILFTISVGPADKNTLATWYMESYNDLIDAIYSLENSK
ncbi:glycosyltransferase family 20-domain-containing protein [Cunninghamella echinulata]|nr:glycosyltransferase family 20-domain-containing protein [Cunninghamella echinulata]